MTNSNNDGNKIKIRVEKPVIKDEQRVAPPQDVKEELPEEIFEVATEAALTPEETIIVEEEYSTYLPQIDKSPKAPEERKSIQIKLPTITIPKFSLPKFKRPAFLDRKKGEKATDGVKKEKAKETTKVKPKTAYQEKKRKLATEPKIFRRFSIKELVHFAKRLAFLIRSGVPVLESLQILQKQTRSASRARILQVITDDVANGRPLSSGLARFKDSFGDFTVSVVRVGEMSGTLSTNLTYLAEELHKRHTLRRKVIGALVYPAFITVATIGVTVLLTVFIFPKVMPIFTSLNVTLPFTTKVLLFMSNFLREYGFYLLGAIVVFIIALVFAIRTSKPFHYFIARNILRLPLVGALILHYNMTNFCRTLGILLRSGFNVVDAATVTSDSTPNPVYKLECVTLREKIVQGERISQHLESNKKLFPDIVCHMVMIGETSGTLSDTLMYLADHYEAEVDDMVKNLSNSIEPVLMIFMGLVVGFVAVSVITPIYEVTQHLSR